MYICRVHSVYYDTYCFLPFSHPINSHLVSHNCFMFSYKQSCYLFVVALFLLLMFVVVVVGEFSYSIWSNLYSGGWTNEGSDVFTEIKQYWVLSSKGGITTTSGSTIYIDCYFVWVRNTFCTVPLPVFLFKLTFFTYYSTVIPSLFSNGIKVL